MVGSMYAAIAGLKTHQSKMNVIGNNIANCNTYGYKTSRATFQDSIYMTSSHSSGGNDVYGGTNASQIGYGCQLASIDKIFTESTPAITGREADCMITGNGFFLMGTKLDVGVTGVNPTMGGADTDEDDITSLMLSRVGNFTRDEDGYIVDSQGYVVYGFSYEGDVEYPIDPGAQINEETLVPLRIPPASAQTGTGGSDLEEGQIPDVSISIDEKGVVTATVADGESFTVGIIALANVPNTGGLEQQSGPYYRIGNNTGTVKAFQPGEGTTATLQTGALEMANVDIANEFAEMITTQRGFQANTRIITVTDQMLEELVNIKR